QADRVAPARVRAGRLIRSPPGRGLESKEQLVGRSRVLVAAIVVLAVGVSAPAALGAGAFRPRIGAAMGLVAPVARQARLRAGDVASGALTPVTYHGGPVMADGVTIHTIFWAPSGFAFLGSPGPGIPTYK